MVNFLFHVAEMSSWLTLSPSLFHVFSHMVIDIEVLAMKMIRFAFSLQHLIVA